MHRGISPVVGIVLLIAVSVIAVVGVWFWMGNYTSKPEVINVPYAKPALTVVDFEGYSAVVSNVGGVVADSAALVYNASGDYVGYLALNETPLQAGSSGVIDFVSVVDTLYAGEYSIVSDVYPMTTFYLPNDYLKPVYVLFFGSQDSHVYAVYAKNGSQYWNYSMYEGTESSPAVRSGMLFIGGGYTNGTLYALNASNGSKIWEFNTTYLIRSSPLVINNVVYFESNDGSLYAFYSNGTQKWNASIGASSTEHRSSPTNYSDVIIVGSGDQGITSSTNGKVYWFYSNGTQKCYYDVSGETDYSSPLVKNGVVYIGSGRDGNNTFALYAGNCSKKWNRSLNSHMVSSPVVSGELMIISTDRDGNTTYAINITNGEIVWNYTAGADVSSSAFVYEGMVFVGSDDDYLHVLNLSTGEELWNYSTGGDVDCSPVVHDDVAYFGSSDGYFYAVNTTSHEQLWNFSALPGYQIDSSPALCNIRNWNCIYPTISGMSN